MTIQSFENVPLTFPEFVGHTIDDADISDQNRTNVVIQAKEDKWVESTPVKFEELMARIRHIVLANRLRVSWLEKKAPYKIEAAVLNLFLM